MFSAITSRCQSYVGEIPANTLDTVVKSVVYSFMVNILIVRVNPIEPYNLARPLVASGVGAVAAAIYGLTAPVFHRVFGTWVDDRMCFHRELIKVTFVNVLTSALLSYATTMKVNLLAFTWLRMVPVSLFLSTFEMGPTFLEWMGDSETARSMRAELEKWGVNTRSNSGSIFIAL